MDPQALSGAGPVPRAPQPPHRMFEDSDAERLAAAAAANTVSAAVPPPPPLPPPPPAAATGTSGGGSGNASDTTGKKRKKLRKPGRGGLGRDLDMPSAVPALPAFDAGFVKDLSVPDRSHCIVDSSLKKVWMVKNTGGQAWLKNVKLMYLGGDLPPTDQHMRLCMFGRLPTALDFDPSAAGDAPVAGAGMMRGSGAHNSSAAGNASNGGGGGYFGAGGFDGGWPPMMMGGPGGGFAGRRLPHIVSDWIPATLPGKSCSIAVEIQVPSYRGVFRGLYQLADPDNQLFGPRLSVCVVARQLMDSPPNSEEDDEFEPLPDDLDELEEYEDEEDYRRMRGLPPQLPASYFRHQHHGGHRAHGGLGGGVGGGLDEGDDDDYYEDDLLDQDDPDEGAISAASSTHAGLNNFLQPLGRDSEEHPFGQATPADQRQNQIQNYNQHSALVPRQQPHQAQQQQQQPPQRHRAQGLRLSRGVGAGGPGSGLDETVELLDGDGDLLLEEDDYEGEAEEEDDDDMEDLPLPPGPKPRQQHQEHNHLQQPPVRETHSAVAMAGGRRPPPPPLRGVDEPRGYPGLHDSSLSGHSGSQGGAGGSDASSVSVGAATAAAEAQIRLVLEELDEEEPEELSDRPGGLIRSGPASGGPSSMEQRRLNEEEQLRLDHKQHRLDEAARRRALGLRHIPQPGSFLQLDEATPTATTTDGGFGTAGGGGDSRDADAYSDSVYQPGAGSSGPSHGAAWSAGAYDQPPAQAYGGHGHAQQQHQQPRQHANPNNHNQHDYLYLGAGGIDPQQLFPAYSQPAALPPHLQQQHQQQQRPPQGAYGQLLYQPPPPHPPQHHGRHLAEHRPVAAVPSNPTAPISPNVWIDLRDIRWGCRIGKGAYGEVFQGSLWGQPVAVKKLFTRGLRDKDLKNFEKEVRIMQALRHPNVVEFLGAIYEKPLLCLITEYMPRGSLDDLLARHRQSNPPKRLSNMRILHYAKEIAKGLNWLHHRGIIHRDLKTDNVLVGENNRLKLCDFGLSHIKSRPLHDTGLYGICGTPCYMAPEVIRKQPYGVKCDVFSFGMVLLELVMGEYPLEHITMPSDSDTFDQVIADGFRPPVPDHCHPDFRRLIERCWATDPDERPSVDETIEILHEIERKMASEVQDALEDVSEEVAELFKEQQRRVAELELELRKALADAARERQTRVDLERWQVQFKKRLRRQDEMRRREVRKEHERKLELKKLEAKKEKELRKKAAAQRKGASTAPIAANETPGVGGHGGGGGGLPASQHLQQHPQHHQQQHQQQQNPAHFQGQAVPGTAAAVQQRSLAAQPGHNSHSHPQLQQHQSLPHQQQQQHQHPQQSAPSGGAQASVQPSQGTLPAASTSTRPASYAAAAASPQPGAAAVAVPAVRPAAGGAAAERRAAKSPAAAGSSSAAGHPAGPAAAKRDPQPPPPAAGSTAPQLRAKAGPKQQDKDKQQDKQLHLQQQQSAAAAHAHAHPVPASPPLQASARRKPSAASGSLAGAYSNHRKKDKANQLKRAAALGLGAPLPAVPLPPMPAGAAGPAAGAVAPGVAGGVAGVAGVPPAAAPAAAVAVGAVPPAAASADSSEEPQ